MNTNNAVGQGGCAWAKLLQLLVSLRAGCVLLALVFLPLLAVQGVQAQQVGADFDHSSTGFVLNGQHQNVRCETCHLKGGFKGTPKTCEGCHGWNNPRATYSVMPITHIPTGNASCDTCHQSTAAQFVEATVGFSHALVVGQTRCNTCHDGFHPNVLGSPKDANHAAVATNNLSCDACHVTSSFSTLNKFSHAGITSGCASCHDTGATRFPNIVRMPSSSGPGPSSHIPITTGCETCHAGSIPSTIVSVLSIGSVPGSGFQNPRPSTAVIHGASNLACAVCHESGASWIGVDLYPRTTSFNAQANMPYIGFQTRPGGGGAYGVTDTAHPVGGDCGTCHTPSAGFAATNFRADHIPIAAGATCVACHKNADYTVMPSVTDIHANARAGLACADCHTDATKYPMTPAIVAVPANHIAMNGQSCETCHAGGGSSLMLPVQDGAKFSGSSFSHNGISSGCASCHSPNGVSATFYGISNIVPMPASGSPGASSHIPTSAACETCHRSAPVGLLPGNATKTAPGTGFISPPPTKADIHANVSVSCASCHETSMSWMGVDQYPRTASFSVVGASYIGFQTRPGSGVGYSLADASHASAVGGTGASADCSACHSVAAGFGAPVQAGNHIPTNAACSNCHKSADYKLMPAITDIHANASTTVCATCHGNTTTYPMSPVITAPPSGHIGMASLGCDGCHVGSGSSMPTTTVQNGASFANSAYNHSSVSTGCATCHGAAAAAIYGVAPKNIASLSPPHMPVGTLACETCHTSNPGTTLVPLSGATGGTPTFAGASFTHSGIVASCDSCHGQTISSGSFAGNPNIVVMPQSSVTGANSHIPTTAACQTCHTGTPAGLIAANAPGGTTGFKTTLPTPANIHANTTTGCAACHESGTWIGVDLYARTTTTPYVSGTYLGFQVRPTPSGGLNAIQDTTPHPPTGECSNCHVSYASGFAAPGLPGGHIPTNGTGCASCHKDPSYSVMPAIADIHTFAAVGATCAQCHGNASTYPMTPAITAPPTGHIALNGNGCEVCHVGAGSSMPTNTVANGASFANSAYSHAGVTAACATCHGAGVSFYGITPKSISNVSPPHLPLNGSPACETCHTGGMPATLIPLAGASGAMTTFAGATFNHSASTASCATCHGQNISSGSFAGNPNIVVMPQSGVAGPGAHIPSSAACDACHTVTPSGSIPANATAADGFRTTLPSTANIHSNTSAACASCHEAGLSWIGVGLYTRDAPFDGAKITPYVGFQARPNTAGSGYSLADSSHPSSGDCANCHSLAIGFKVPDQPANHIPTVAACSACHKNVGTSYKVMPSVTDIHANASTNVCATCHANTTTYPMTPVIVAPPARHIAMGNLGCDGCHVGSASSMLSTTVVNGASFANSAFSHSGASTACDTCHGTGAGAANLYGVTPKNIASLSPAHMPVTSGAACESCHTTSPGSTQVPLSGATGGTPTFAGASFIHSLTSASCASCHGQNVSGASFAGNANIIGMPQSGVPGPDAHVATVAACSVCHGVTSSTVFPGISANAIGTSAFRLNPPNSATLHGNVSSNCTSCHEAGMSWIGLGLYARTTGPTYTGFQTRPTAGGDTYSVIDTSHPVAGQCSNCHSVAGGFGAPAKPTGHIPVSPAGDGNCALCHKSPDYSVMPSLTDIHANFLSGTTCAQCHGNTTTYPMTPAIVAPPTGHIAQGGLGCEACHVGTGSSMASTPVQDGAHFSGSLFSHSGISSGCDACHGAGVSAANFYGMLPKALANLSPGHIPAPNLTTCETCHINSIPSGLVPSAGMKTFAGALFTHTGITNGCDTCHGPNIVPGSFAGNPNLVVMPKSSPFGATAHIPSSTTCESCHLGSTPSGLVAGSAAKMTGPGTGFQSPAPTSSMVHANVTGSCASCHGDGQSWIGVGLYPSTPLGYVAHATYTGFQTRPGAGGSYAVNDSTHPGAGLDCSQCHSSFTGFGPPTMPSGHIPVAPAAACGNCHTSNFVDAPTLTNIHANAQSTTANCVQCHSTTSAAQFKVTRAIVTPDGNHIPMGALSCESCHMGPLSSIKGAAVVTGDKFAGSLFNHSGISSGCNACHGVTVDATTFPGIPGIKAISYDVAPVHMRVPSAIGCEVCHTNSVPTGQVPAPGMKTFAGASFTHSGITSDCAKCHGPTITPASFLGSPTIVVMPVTTSGGHIPSSAVCESCHLGSTPSALIAGNATKTAPGTGFKVSLPGSAAIHANSDTTSCNVCHESGKDWLSVGAYTRGPSNSPSAGSLFTGFQTRPIAGGGIYSVNDGTHVGVGQGDCSNCHTGYTGFGPPTVPANHIPYIPGTSCGSCHTDPNFAAMPAYGNIHRYALSATTNCVQCHSATNADIYNQLSGMAGKLLKPAANHIAMAALGCESCHVDSLTGLTSNATPSFAGGKYSHSGVTSGCNTCHVSGTGPFQGTLSIIVMPATSPAVAASHLPTSTTCETCHLGSTPSTLLPAVATNTAAISTFATPVPTAAMVHSGVTSSCSTCHEAGGSSTSDVWMNMAAYPITTTAPYKGFQVRPSTTGQFRVADGVHPTAGDCSACHSSFTDFATTVMPQNHIPTASVACTNCHASSNYTTMPTFTAIHANAQSTSTNCVQCHSTANAATYNQLAGMAGKLKSPPSGHVDLGGLGCESCHASSGGVTSSLSLPVLTGAAFTNSAFSHGTIKTGCATCHSDSVTPLVFAGQTVKGVPAGHVPNTGSVDCVACHLTAPSALIAYSGAGAVVANTFKTTSYSHSGITTNCKACHAGGASFTGITNLVVLSAFPTHIPTTTKPDCESCHLGSTPTVAKTVTGSANTAGGTGFKTPIPTGTMIHDGITVGCVSCHESGMGWLGVDTSFYPRTAAKPATTYLGFQTRPTTAGGGYSITDSSHPQNTTDCYLCHATSGFSVAAVPSNHIPFAPTATCNNCHTNMTTDLQTAVGFSAVPSLTNIHRYAPSSTSNCAQCHSDTNAVKFNAGGVVIKSPSSIARHVPSGSVACEVCHNAIGTVSDSSKFTGGKYSHSGVTTGCAACHGNGLAANYFTGISNLVAIPATAAMGSASHIPYTAACEACHAGSTPSASTLYAVSGAPAAVSGFRLPAPTSAQIHSNVSSGCNACHDSNYLWKGMDLYPINPKVVVTGANYTGFQTRPIAAPGTAYGITDSLHPVGGDCSQCHTSTSVFTGLAKPAGHMPTATNPACSVCHSATDYSVAGLATVSAMHTGVTYQTTIKVATAASMAAKLCVNCHAVGLGGTSGSAPFTGCTTASVANCASPPAQSTYQPATVALHPNHVPIGNSDCNACHVSVTSFAGVNMKNATMHTSANSVAGVQCQACHEAGDVWYGVTNLKVRPTPTDKNKTPHPNTGGKKPNMGAPNDCNNSGCHSYNGGFRAMVRPIMRDALVSPNMGRIRPNVQTGRPSRGSLGNVFDHKGVAAGQCKKCHDGVAASGMPSRHLMVATSCDTCHRPTTWLPAQFNHNGTLPDTCLACHNGMGASNKPAGHFMTFRSCDTCHKTMGWKPTNYRHLSPLYRESPDKLTCISCHDTNGEIIRRQARALNRTKPIAVGP